MMPVTFPEIYAALTSTDHAQITRAHTAIRALNTDMAKPWLEFMQRRMQHRDRLAA